MGKKLHYAWLILAGCCILQGASLGLINNCAGVFYSPVCEELGFEMGGFAFYKTLFSISSALALPFVAKSFRKMDVRLVISAAAVVFGGCNVDLSPAVAVVCGRTDSGSGLFLFVHASGANSFRELVP